MKENYGPQLAKELYNIRSRFRQETAADDTATEKGMKLWQRVMYPSRPTYGTTTEVQHRLCLNVTPEDLPTVLTIIHDNIVLPRLDVSPGLPTVFEWLQTNEMRTAFAENRFRVGSYANLKAEDELAIVYFDSMDDINQAAARCVSDPRWTDVEQRRRESFDEVVQPGALIYTPRGEERYYSIVYQEPLNQPKT